MLALRRFDMANTVQLRRALRLEEVRLRPPSEHFSSVASSEQSFKRFMKRVKNLERNKGNVKRLRKKKREKMQNENRRDSKQVFATKQNEKNK